MSEERRTIATVKDGRICLAAPIEYGQRCRQVPGSRWHDLQGIWTAPATPATAQAVLDALRGTAVRADPGFRALVQQARAIRNSAAIKDAETLPPIPTARTEPWKHQLRGVWFASAIWGGIPGNGGGAMLGMAMGTGKSACTIHLSTLYGFRKILIVCPLSVIPEWPNQFMLHSKVKFHIVTLGAEAGSVKDKLHALQIGMHEAEISGLPFAAILNLDAVWRDPLAEYLLDSDINLVVADEIHRLMSPGGRCSRYMAKLGQRVPYRLGLTGTPFSSGPLSIYGQYRFLDPGIFGTNYDEFRRRYAVTKNALVKRIQQVEADWPDATLADIAKATGAEETMVSRFRRVRPVPGPADHQVLYLQNQEELQRKFYSIAYRVESRDVLTLPDEMHTRRFCVLGRKAAKAYREMERELYTEIEAGECTAANCLVKILRLQQLTSGFLRTDDTDDEEGQVVRIDTAKQELLADTLGDLGQREPVVVFVRWRHDLDAIREVCEGQRRRYMELSGRIKQTEQWKAGEADVLGVQIRSGGLGISLVRSAYCCYYSIGYVSLGDYSQSLARTMRPGQHRNVDYIHFMAKDTIDVKVYDSMDKKRDIIQSLLGSQR